MGLDTVSVAGRPGGDGFEGADRVAKRRNRSTWVETSASISGVRVWSPARTWRDQAGSTVGVSPAAAGVSCDSAGGVSSSDMTGAAPPTRLSVFRLATRPLWSQSLALWVPAIVPPCLTCRQSAGGENSPSLSTVGWRQWSHRQQASLLLAELPPRLPLVAAPYLPRALRAPHPATSGSSRCR